MSVDIGELLQLCVNHNASDLHITVGKPPTLRIDGALMSMNYDPLKHEDTEQLMKSITSTENQRRVQEIGGVDFGFAFEKIARFRVSVYKQKGHYGLTLRLIPTRLLTFDEIGLPKIIRDLLYRPRGLILVTGPTGSGKTTTLATMTDFVNTERDCHIITIEDPVEYYHTHKKGIVTQREIGIDVPSFSEGLVRGLRQDPDLILVGEMRDLTTIEAAILAAETGHLVLATLHTTSAAATVDRIIDVFPPNQQEQIRTQLSTSILAIVSQQLIVRSTGRGRVAAFEIMVSTPSIQNLIREKKTFRITSDLQTGAKYGMKPFDNSLFDLYSAGHIRQEDAVAKAFDQDMMQRKIQEGV
ncbi:MAG: type IV pilus twitching motility protein PilT [PVC group bacterium]|nr:type IV pilus twitching motility protein PilT [PVC group bacterium]